LEAVVACRGRIPSGGVLMGLARPGLVPAGVTL